MLIVVVSKCSLQQFFQVPMAMTMLIVLCARYSFLYVMEERMMSVNILQQLSTHQLCHPGRQQGHFLTLVLAIVQLVFSARVRAEELNLKVQRAEALFVHFIAEHNMPFRTGDHFTKLVKKMFPDSEIARQFQCSQTKTSVLANYGNGKWVHDQLVASLADSSEPVLFQPPSRRVK